MSDEPDELHINEHWYSRPPPCYEGDHKWEYIGTSYYDASVRIHVCRTCFVKQMVTYASKPKPDMIGPLHGLY